MEKLKFFLLIFLLSYISFFYTTYVFSQNEVNIKEKNLKFFNSGIDFYASGNEPFWNIEISYGQYIRFKLLDGPEVFSEYVEGVRTADENIIQYNISDANFFVSITISHNECSDNMSEEIFSYSIDVNLKRKDDNTISSLNGCGRYTPDYFLNGEWELFKINNNEVKYRDYNIGFPSLTIDVDEKKYSSRPGCNIVNGSIWFENKTLRFLDGVTTLMTCPDIEKERLFIESLRKTIYYKIVNNKLILLNPEKTLMEFTRKTESSFEKPEPDALNSLYRLNDIWVLESLNGKKVKIEDFMKELPMIEIHVKDMKYMGYSGCNRINGKIYTNKNKIIFFTPASTLLSCPGNPDKEFLESLMKVNKYDLGNNRLSLFFDEDILIVFKKVD